MWPFKKKLREVQVWKVEYVLGCSIKDGQATFDLGAMQEDFVVTGPLGTMYDAASAFVKRVGILPHGYIHRVTMVKRISK